MAEELNHRYINIYELNNMENNEIYLEDKLERTICSFLDENIPDAFKNIQRCLEEMELQRNELEKQMVLSQTHENKAESGRLCVGKTIEDAKLTLTIVDEIQLSFNELKRNVEKHNEDVHATIEQLNDLNESVIELENLITYIKWIQRVEDLSCTIHISLERGSVKEVISQLQMMKSVSDALAETLCSNLKKFALGTLKYWHGIVIEQLSKEFNEVIETLKWPFTSGSTAPPLSTNINVFQTLETLFLMLFEASEIERNFVMNGAEKQKRIITLPLELLLQPLQKRFYYHFYGKRQTNNAEKPEWFFTQILNWLRDHEDFLHSAIQPIIDKLEISCPSAWVQFTEGLLQLVVEKMNHSLKFVVEDEALFSHLVDETLLFDQELRNTYELSQVQSNCLQVLTQKQYFPKWIALEKKYAMENIQMLLSSEKAWSPRYEDAADVDELKVPECVETFVSLLVGITDRYRNLPDEEHRIAFVDIQLDLLYYITASLDEMRNELSEPLSTCFIFVLNSTNYLSTILRDWCEQTVFLRLYLAKTELYKLKQNENESPHSKNNGFTVVNEDFGSNTLFDEAIEQLIILQNDMIRVLVKHVTSGFISRSDSYQKESWHSLPSQKDLAITSLSSSLCDMIVYLRDALKKIKQDLVDCLFTIFWKELAQEICEFLLNEVILKSHFNEGGAAQLKFDIHKNFFVLFGQFTAKPENYFRKLKEAIILLNLMPGSAILLKEEIVEKRRKKNEERSRDVLDDIDVYTLSFDEVLNVLNSRINRSK